MKVLVTGADGMLGNHICRELLSKKYQVRGMIQPGRRTGTLDHLELETVNSDLLIYQDLMKALNGCDVVIHTAASTQIWPSRSPLIWEVNYDGTLLLAKAVLELGVQKLIHIGTANSFGSGSKSNPGTEETPYTGGIFKLDYQDSKHAAQIHLLDLAKSDKLPVVIINPSYMFGAYDSQPGSGKMILSLHKGRITGYTRGGRSYIAAKDVATCVVNAIAAGVVGECYLASGVNLNFQEVFSLIAETIGVAPPNLYVPDPLIDAIGLFGSLIGNISKKPPLISYPMARLAHTECYYSNAKAVRELGLPQTPLRDAILECFNWFKQHDHL